MAFSLDATVSGEDSNSYLTVTEADELANYIPEGDLYLQIPQDERAKWLVRATTQMEIHCTNSVIADKADADQALLFPVTDETEVSKDIKLACIAQAGYAFANKTQFFSMMHDQGLDEHVSGDKLARIPNVISRACRFYLRNYYKLHKRII